MANTSLRRIKNCQKFSFKVSSGLNDQYVKAHLGACDKSKMELFFEKDQWPKATNYCLKEAPSRIFGKVLNTFLIWMFCWKSFLTLIALISLQSSLTFQL